VKQYGEEIVQLLFPPDNEDDDDDLQPFDVLSHLFVQNTSNELLQAAMNVARRRGRDLTMAVSLAHRELTAVLARVGSSDEAFKAAMGSLMRVDSPATKSVRELLRNRCYVWLERQVSPLLVGARARFAHFPSFGFGVPLCVSRDHTRSVVCVQALNHKRANRRPLTTASVCCRLY
jgi:hypothetical protein